MVAQDAPRTNALLKEFGGEMIEQIRFNPVASIDKLEKTSTRASRSRSASQASSRASTRTVRRRPASRSTRTSGAWRPSRGRSRSPRADWPDVDGVRVIETTVHGSDGARGLFERAYDPKTGVANAPGVLQDEGAKKAIPGKVSTPASRCCRAAAHRRSST